MMRSLVSVTLVSLIILVCLSLPAYAGQPYTGSYTLKASSPIDDPSTSPIEASAGMPITIEADATGTYSGPISLTLPSFNVDIGYSLKHGGVTIDSKKDSYPVASMHVDPGKKYSEQGSKSYTLPSDIAPGDYTLDCTATVSILGIGRTEHASFPIKVVGGALPEAAASTVHTSISSAENASRNTSPSITADMNSPGPSHEAHIDVADAPPKKSDSGAGPGMDLVGVLRLVIDGLWKII